MYVRVASTIVRLASCVAIALTMSPVSHAAADPSAEAKRMADNYEDGDSSFAFETYKIEPGGYGVSECDTAMADTTEIRGPYKYSCRRWVLARDPYQGIHKFSAIACRHGHFSEQARINASAETSFMIDGYQTKIRKALGSNDAFYFRPVRASTHCRELDKDTGKDPKTAKVPPDEEPPDDEVTQEIPKAAPQPDPNAVTFVVRSYDPHNVSFAAYSPDRSKRWPEAGSAWRLSSEPQRYKLACTPGEQICWGAWRHEDRTVNWGMGHGRSACTSCCVACGVGEHVVNLNAGREGPPPDRLTVSVTSNSPYPVELRFFSGDRSKQIPGGDQVYKLITQELYSFSCVPGEQICYGASVSGNPRSYWGVGVNGQQGCTDCCMTCGSGRHEFTLNGGETQSAVAQGGGGGGGASAIINGLAAGIAIGSAFRRGSGGGGGFHAPSQPPIRSTPRPYGGSDISGTH